jgi:hypothetical protein
VLEHAQGNHNRCSVMAELIWHTPKDLILGTPLSEEHLNAICIDRDNAALVDGVSVYTPPLGTVLTTEGNHLLRVIFTPKHAKKYGEIYSSEVSVAVIDKKKLPHLNQMKPVKDAVRTKTGYISVAKTDACRTMVFHRMVLNSKVLKKSKFGDMEVSMRVSAYELSPVEMLDIVDRVNGTVNFYCQSKFLELTTEEFLNTHLIISLRGHSIITKKKVEYYCSVSVPLVEFMTVNEGPFTISLIAHPKLYFPENGLTMRTDALNEQCKMQIAIVAHAYEPVHKSGNIAAGALGAAAFVESDDHKKIKPSGKKFSKLGGSSATSPKPASVGGAAGSPAKLLRPTPQVQRVQQHVQSGNLRKSMSESFPRISQHTVNTPMSMYPFGDAVIEYDAPDELLGAGGKASSSGNGRSTSASATATAPAVGANIGVANDHVNNGKSKGSRRPGSAPCARKSAGPLRGQRLDFRDVSVPFHAEYGSGALPFGNDSELGGTIPAQSEISPALASLISAAADDLIASQRQALFKERKEAEAAVKASAIHGKVAGVRSAYAAATGAAATGAAATGTDLNSVAYASPLPATKRDSKAKDRDAASRYIDSPVSKPKKSNEWH